MRTNTTAAVVITIVLCISRKYASTSSLNLHDKLQANPHHLPSKPHNCITTELVGKWISVDRTLPKHQFNAPHCCPNDGGDLHLITDESKEFCRLPTLVRIAGHGCRCLPGSERAETLDSSLSWMSVFLPQWNATKSCHLLSTRRVLVLGDSTLQQATSVLSGSFHQGSCGAQIQFEYADTLVGKNLGAMNRGKHWLTLVEKNSFPEIVIIGTSAHILKEADFTLAAEEIFDNIVQLRQDHPEVTVVWKTTSPAGWADKVSPHHPLDAGQLSDFETGPRWQYWKGFYARDTFMVKKMIDLGVPILDCRMLYARMDAHVGKPNDGMHYCAPGPLDVIPQLFQKLLSTNLHPSECININV